MLPAAQTFVTPDFRALAAVGASANDTEGRRIRLAAADLYRQGRLAEADLLTRAALQHYPDNEDVLIIRALICEVQHDWPQAAAALEHLTTVQGTHTPAETWYHRVRVLRCHGQLSFAMNTALQALKLHPNHQGLSSELAQLEAMGVAL